MKPLATITSRMWRWVAPRAASSPSWRWRRWATTTKPAAAMSATRAMARVTTISTKARTACFSLPMTSTRNADMSAAGSSAVARAAAAAVRPSEARSRVKRSAGAAGSGTTRAKSSARSPGFSTRPDDGQGPAAQLDLPADAGGQQFGGAVGEGHLAARARVAAVAQPQHRPAQPAFRILGPEVDGLGRPGHRHRRVADDLDVAEPLPDGGHVGLRQRRVAAVDLDASAGPRRAGPGSRRPPRPPWPRRPRRRPPPP